MATRYLYVARHGEADAFGKLTDTGYEQARLLGRRLAKLPISAVWHSPLPRAETTARQLDLYLSGNPEFSSCPELIDHVPYVPPRSMIPDPWLPFFDGFSEGEAEAGYVIARGLVERFARPPEAGKDLHEVLITHAYPIAWLLRDAFGAPPERWLGLESANAALTVIEYRPNLPPSVVMFNDMSHLPVNLRWTGFPERFRA